MQLVQWFYGQIFMLSIPLPLKRDLDGRNKSMVTCDSLISVVEAVMLAATSTLKTMSSALFRGTEMASCSRGWILLFLLARN